MKSYEIVLLVLSLSLVGSVSNSYAETGTFLDSFDGSDGDGMEFQDLQGLAVDNSDRIIITDISNNRVQIYEYDGTFVTSFNGIMGGGTTFAHPHAVAVDSQYRIIVVDTVHDIIQIYDSTGFLQLSFDGGDFGGTDFEEPYTITVDSKDRILVGERDLGTVQVFNSDGTFVFSIDGSDGGEAFTSLNAIAVDNSDRILVGDGDLDTVQIFDEFGNFDFSFNGVMGGGTAFMNPTGIAVDSENRIIITDPTLGFVQIYDSNGVFLDSIDGSDSDIGLGVPFTVAVDSDDRIIITDISNDLVQIFAGFTEEDEPADPVDEGTDSSELLDEPEDPNGGCADCTPPTLGLNPYYIRVVDNGFSYNGNSTQVEKWHTPFPLITAEVGKMNTVEIIVYENSGIYNMAIVQFGLGASEIGQPLNDLEVLIEVWLETFNLTDQIVVEKIIIKDRDNLIDTYSVFAVVDVVKCQAASLDEVCIKVTLEYSYREATINNIMVVNVVDKARNTQNFFFNDGVEVVGVSLNPPPTYELSNRNLKQQTEDLTLTLTRTDKVNHIWVDDYGIEYLHVSPDRFDRITPLEPMGCTDPPLSEINVPNRMNCNFRALTSLWSVG